jgi:2-amino-4-hydroxy-6-hydroxymethyldihydropteridine diphosphokinase
VPDLFFIALGSNLGDRLTNLITARARLREMAPHLQSSFVYESAPRYITDQPTFLNAVVMLENTMSPIDMLQNLKKIEQDMGRQKTMRYGPRLIDLDIIYAGRHLLQTPELTLPHPARRERLFVLKPLCDLAPDFLDPETGESLQRTLDACRDKDDVVRQVQQWDR